MPKRAGVSAIALLLSSVAPVMAQDRTWTGAAGNNNWFTPGNWSGNSVPTNLNNANISSTIQSIIAAPGAAANQVSLGTTAGSNGTLTVNGGTLTSTSGNISSSATSQAAVTVTGSSSSWSTSSGLTVGVGGRGALSISNEGAVTANGGITVGGSANSTGTLLIDTKGTLTTRSATIGSMPGSRGDVTVTGNGSSWSNPSGSFQVGNNGTATLTVSNGASVNTSAIIISQNNGSNGAVVIQSGGKVNSNGPSQFGIGTLARGTMTVTGDQSSWNNGTGAISVGYGGEGSLTISDKGTVSGGNVYVGETNSARGTLRIESGGRLTSLSGFVGNGANTDVTAIVTGSASDGSVSKWTTGPLTVGTSGKGTLTIADKAEVQAGSVTLGQSAGSVGIITVTDKASKLSSTGTLAVGNSGTGTLSVSNGAQASGGTLRVGFNAGAVGAVSVSGGSTLSSTAAIIGNAAASGTLGRANGSVTVTGPDSIWANSGSLTIGSSGQGALTISSGGSATASSVIIGQNSGSTGTLDINNGGKLTNATAALAGATLGDNAGAAGTATVTGSGSAWTGIGTLNIGNRGTGTLTVSDKAQVSASGLNVGYYSSSGNAVRVESGGRFSSATSNIGREAGAAGSVTVTGNDSNWKATGDIGLGLSGAGTLSVSNSGSVDAADIKLGLNSGGNGTLVIDSAGSISGVNGYIGQGAGGTGSATVSGAGSRWINSGEVSVGNNGTGTLLVEKGGYVSSLTAKVGRGTNEVNSATVTGDGSQWAVTEVLTVGNKATLIISDRGKVTAGGISVGYWSNQDATLNLLNGGTLNTATGIIGEYDGTSKGTATVSGAGSAWTSTGDLIVGRNGMGNLAISDEGAVSAKNILLGSTVNVGSSTGTVSVTGAGAKLTATDALSIGNNAAGTLTLSDGALASASVVHLARSGGATGTLNIGAASGQAAVAAGLLNAPSLIFGTGRGTGTLVFNHTNSDYLFSAAMSGAGNIRAENGETVLTGDSSGFTGNTSILSGATLQVGDGATSGSLGGSILANGSLVFDRRDNTSFAGAISGTGSLTKNGAGTLLLSGNSAGFTGATTLAQGGLEVNGSLAGSTVTARSGTLLSGTGTVGGVVAQAGSVITPGSSPGAAPNNGIGTLSVSGNYQQQSGAAYAVQVQPGSTLSDTISVAGAAVIESGAILNVTKSHPGDYTLSDVYKVLSATGGLTGTFTVTGDTAISNFYSLQAVYEADAAYLKAVQFRNFAEAGLTPNQIATADGLNSLPTGNDLHDAVADLGSDEEARQAFDLLSGEIHASIAGAMAEQTGMLRKATLDRLRCRDRQPQGGAARPLTCSEGAVWAQGFGASGATDGDGNAARLKEDMEGFILGADLLVAEDWRLGMLGAYNRAQHDVSKRNSSGESESYWLGLYGGAEWNSLGLRLGGAYSWNTVQTERDVAFTGYSDHLSANYDSGTAQLFGELAYGINAGPATFEPFAGIAYVNVDTESFSEDGGSAALTSTDTDTGVTFSTLGLRAAVEFGLGDFILTASGSAGWRHAWGDITPDMGFAFNGSDAFVIRGVPIAEDAAAIEAGLTAGTEEGASFGLFYDGQFGDGTQSQGLRGSLVLPF